MCDNQEPYTLTMALCSNGLTPTGWECTGHAHMYGEHIKCVDESHKAAVKLKYITIPHEGISLSDLMVGSQPVTYPLNGSEKWTCG